jgi:SAM-dependent methyltransferase
MRAGNSMADSVICFDAGAAYERMMGTWSRLAGSIFLDWLAAPARLHWLDVGCGNGAFTAMLYERCAPASVTGVDPSEGQLDYDGSAPTHWPRNTCKATRWRCPSRAARSTRA